MAVIGNNRGFTLIEALISLGVFAIGIIALFSTQTYSIRGNASASKITTLANWGSDEVEEMISEKYVNIVDKDPVNISGDGKYTVSRSVVEGFPCANVKQIAVTITSKADNKQVVLRYYKANESAM